MVPEILFQDNDLIVVEKPAGLPSCARRPGEDDPDTVEGWLHRQFPSARLVHRLDNDTSGLMIAAKDEKTFQELRKIWNTPTVVKTYHAIVAGRTPPQGAVTTPIAHHPRKKKKMVTGGKKSRPAATSFKTLKHLDNGTSLLEIQITTGVRHQIRMHLASIGHPIIGDRLYAKEKSVDTRLHLHLYSITIGKQKWRIEPIWEG